MKVSAIDKKTKTIGRVFSKCEYCDLGGNMSAMVEHPEVFAVQCIPYLVCPECGKSTMVYQTDYAEWLHNECMILVSDGFDYESFPEIIDQEWDDQVWGKFVNLANRSDSLDNDIFDAWLEGEDRNQEPKALAERLYWENIDEHKSMLRESRLDPMTEFGLCHSMFL